MLRLLLLLCSFVVAFANVNNTTVFTVSPSFSPMANTSTVLSSTMSPNMTSSHYVSVSSTFPNGTVSPTQMPHTMNMTSAAPTPMTSSAVPTTSPVPTPPLDYGDYDVEEDNKKCLLAQLDVMFHVKYHSTVVTNTTTNSTKNESMTTKIHLPYPRNHPSVIVTGDCHANTSHILVQWPILNNIEPLFRFRMDFKTYHPDKNNTNVTKWEVASISLLINTKDNPNFTNPAEPTIRGYASSKDFKEKVQVAEGSSYQCHSPVTYNLSAVMADFAHVKLQPFDVVNSTFSHSYQACPQDSKPTPTPKPEENNIVPIAVGCALAGLVLIVLIAYIIGRRKSQRGYEKV